MERTISEIAFEEYLSNQGINYRFEELPNGISQPADYSFEISGKTLRIDIKEWKPKEQLQKIGTLNPYMPVRKKIEEGRRKFKQYKSRGEPCVLVLYHYGQQLIVLDDISIFGSMHGNLGAVFSVDSSTGVANSDSAEISFLDGGKMVHHTKNSSVRIQNTTISAIAVLKQIQVRYRRVSTALKRRKAVEDHDFTPEELLAVWRELYSSDKSVEAELRIMVYDNLEAAVPLPNEFPSGPYDERFGIRNNRLCRTFVGAELSEIEKMENEVGIRQSDPLNLRI